MKQMIWTNRRAGLVLAVAVSSVLMGCGDFAATSLNGAQDSVRSASFAIRSSSGGGLTVTAGSTTGVTAGTTTGAGTASVPLVPYASSSHALAEKCGIVEQLVPGPEDVRELQILENRVIPTIPHLTEAQIKCVLENSPDPSELPNLSDFPLPDVSTLPARADVPGIHSRLPEVKR